MNVGMAVTYSVKVGIFPRYLPLISVLGILSQIRFECYCVVCTQLGMIVLCTAVLQVF